MKKTIAFLGAAAALALGAATPSSVPAWIDINAQIPARTDLSTDTVAFTTSADGRTIDEETGRSVPCDLELDAPQSAEEEFWREKAESYFK